MTALPTVPTGIPRLDAVLQGGIPRYSLNIIAGAPGTGKTVFMHQIIFHYVRAYPEDRVLYLTTLSEPVLKLLRYMQQFAFFDANLFEQRVVYHDIGDVVRTQTPAQVLETIRALIERERPMLFVIDSFKAIRDMTPDTTEFRRFCYDLAVTLLAAQCTSFLVGEYGAPEFYTGAEFSIADGILHLAVEPRDATYLRTLRIVKMRGLPIELAPIPFHITSNGIEVLRQDVPTAAPEAVAPARPTTKSTGIPGLDEILRGGVLQGHAVLVSGVSGTGKTILCLQFLMHGAANGERVLFYGFEESPEELMAVADGFGWDLRALLDTDRFRFIWIPTTRIDVETHFDQMLQDILAFQPQRVVVDSFAVLLHKYRDPVLQREKAYHLARVIKHVQAVGLFTSDIAAGAVGHLSRYGVEETVFDGTIVLTSEMAGTRRKRYLEVYKMRGCAYAPGRHRMDIRSDCGVIVYYLEPTVPVGVPERELSFTPIADILRAPLRHGTAWMVEAVSGAGKTALAMQFAVEGLLRDERVLWLAADEPAAAVREAFQRWSPEIASAIDTGRLQIVDPFGTADAVPIDLTDPEVVPFCLRELIDHLGRPCRVILDSLTPLAVQMDVAELVRFIEWKNRILAHPHVAIMDTLLERTLSPVHKYSIANAYDCIVYLYIPEWSQQIQGGERFRMIRIKKARGMRVDPRGYPFRIEPGRGLVVDTAFYASGD